MKKLFKKSIALLVAGVLLTTSAAAYAAQLPNKNEAAQPALTVSPGDLDVDIRLDSYELSSDRLLADFTAVSVMGYQFRTGGINLTVEKEDGVGTSSFSPISGGTFTGHLAN